MPTQDVTQNIDFSSTRKQLDQTESIIGKILETGSPLYALQGLTKRQMELLYKTAYNLYNAKQLKEAETIFTGLCLYDHTEYRYWLGLGLSSLLLKHYVVAVNAFSYAAILDRQAPEPAYHAIECHLMLRDVPKVLAACESVILRSNGKEKYDKLAQRATAIRDALKEEIRKAQAE